MAGVQRPQPVDAIGVDTERPAAGPERWQVGAE